jgi:CRISPR/Cas system-associated exonuclease Cas4 (RecB family)
VVFVPGLAEKIFPHKIVEDPILLDMARRQLHPGLLLQAQRVEGERLALRLAVGAAQQAVHLSYPRLDEEQARPRVPSFYCLEVVRAAEGKLPGYVQLNTRATAQSGGRLGWPAPESPDDAIDAAEYDLALLAPLLQAGSTATTGLARYLVSASPHLARALRARWARWQNVWTFADGLVKPDALTKAALEPHQFKARSYSPTALELYASCPYKFFLSALLRLQPRQIPVAVEHMDPLTRGSLVHEVQFEVLSRLFEDGRLPLSSPHLAETWKLADQVLDHHALQFEEKLSPAIPRVWEDAVNLIRSDVREWLRRLVDSPWIPERFELSFGLSDRMRTQEDPHSVPHAVELGVGLQVRGSIDVVERHGADVRRASDYKTGRVKAHEDVQVQGGEILQPLLYAMVCEELMGGRVEGGRLYYCTTDGNFTERSVPLDESGRQALKTVVDTIGEALGTGHMPAAPHAHACQWCDYRSLCGPHEVQRTRHKPPLDRLAALRDMR